MTARTHAENSTEANPGRRGDDIEDAIANKDAQFVIVPEALDAACARAIEAALNGRDIESDEFSRIRCQLIRYFNEHGALPDFELRDITGDNGT